MALESLDFQSIVHQQTTHLLEQWKQDGFTPEEGQESAAQFFNMGMIAAQQIQQEGAIQPQDTNQSIPYTEDMAQRVIKYFLLGLNAGLLKASENRIPSQEKWQLLQNVAYHVFEQSKQAVVMTLGQENTPEVQISDEQIVGWLSQTAIEALLYYLNEYEKQNGPIARTDEPVMPDLLNQPEEPVQEAPQQSLAETALVQPQQPQPAPAQAQPAPQQPAATAQVPEIHHKYAAVALFVSNLPNKRQQQILSVFQPEEQQLIQQYRDPEVIAQNLDLGRVAKYLRSFKEKMGQPRAAKQSRYASTASEVIRDLPPQRLDRLFQNERPFVRGYVNQFTQASDREFDPYSLPPGVEESLLIYLQRNFPEEVTAR